MSLPTSKPAGRPATVTLRIDSIGAGGVGVGRLPEGKVAFVHRSAPGDLVEAEPVRTGKRWLRARPLRILEEGPGRVEAPCPLFERCGGCQLQHLEGGAQLEAKRQIIADALTRIGGIKQLPAVEMHPAPEGYYYRSRVSFSLLRLGQGRVVAGFHEEERPGRILDVDERCLLPESVLVRGWEALRGAWGPGAGRLPPGGELRLTLRAIDEARFILLIEGGEPLRGAEALAGEGGAEDGRREAVARGVDLLLSEVPGLAALWHWPRDASGWTLLAGEAELRERRQGEELPVRPGSFVQVNRAGSELLHQLALAEAAALGQTGARVVDAYCGVGFYGRRLAREGARVAGIELDPDAAASARFLEADVPDAGKGTGSFELLEGPVEERLAEALPADLVLLNPPRGGAAEGVMEGLAAARPGRIVYISCDPATLARDLARLGDGYRIVRIHGVDLFPQTAHVETVVTLNADEEG